MIEVMRMEMLKMMEITRMETMRLLMMTTFSTTLPAVKRLELKLQEITASGSDSTRQCRVTYSCNKYKNYEGIKISEIKYENDMKELKKTSRPCSAVK